MSDEICECAENGDVKAQLSLGKYYEDKGEYEEAIYWYEKAAKQGSASAQYNLACIESSYASIDEDEYDYETEDRKKARFWLRKAAENGHANAQFYLAIEYDSEKDYEEAVFWYSQAAKQGDFMAKRKLIKAQYELAEEYNTGGKYKEALSLYRQAAKHGHSGAQFMVAMMYLVGDGVNADEKEAFRWCVKAAEQGNLDALCSLGDMHFDGNGVKKDNQTACMWYHTALLANSHEFRKSKDYELYMRELKDNLREVEPYLTADEIEKAKSDAQAKYHEIYRHDNKD